MKSSVASNADAAKRVMCLFLQTSSGFWFRNSEAIIAMIQADEMIGCRDRGGVARQAHVECPPRCRPGTAGVPPAVSLRCIYPAHLTGLWECSDLQSFHCSRAERVSVEIDGFEVRPDPCALDRGKRHL